MKIKAADKQLADLLAETGTGLRNLYGIGPSGAARLLGDIGDITRSPPPPGSLPGMAPHPSTPPAAITNVIDSPALGIEESIESCTSWPSSNYETTHPADPITDANWLLEKHLWKLCAASQDVYQMSSTNNSSATSAIRQRRAREDTWGRL